MYVIYIYKYIYSIRNISIDTNNHFAKIEHRIPIFVRWSSCTLYIKWSIYTCSVLGQLYLGAYIYIYYYFLYMYIYIYVYMGYRRSHILFLRVIVPICMGLCDCVGLWVYEFVGVCGSSCCGFVCVCVFARLCLFAGGVFLNDCGWLYVCVFAGLLVLVCWCVY